MFKQAKMKEKEAIKERKKWTEEWDGTKMVGVGAEKGEGSTG